MLVIPLQSVAYGGVSPLPHIHSRELWCSDVAYCRGGSYGWYTYGKRARGCLGDTAFPGLGVQQKAARPEGCGSSV